MGKSIYAFRSSSLFFSLLSSVAPVAGLSSVLNTDEAQQLAGNSDYVVGGNQLWVPYGIKLTNNGAFPCTNPMRIQPRREYDTVTDGFSDQRYSNHFYRLDMALLPTTTSITLSSTWAGTGTPTDVDLILYRDGYRFNQDCTTDSTGSCATWSKNTSSTDMLLSDRSTGTNLSGTFAKSISGLDSLSASNFYMLDVRAYTANKTTLDDATAYDYTLRTNTGDYLCPSTTY